MTATEIFNAMLLELQEIRKSQQVQQATNLRHGGPDVPNDYQHSPAFEKRRVLKATSIRAKDLLCINAGAELFYWQISIVRPTRKPATFLSSRSRSRPALLARCRSTAAAAHFQMGWRWPPARIKTNSF